MDEMGWSFASGVVVGVILGLALASWAFAMAKSALRDVNKR